MTSSCFAFRILLTADFPFESTNRLPRFNVCNRLSPQKCRINAIKANGTDAQIEVFRGLGHGFELGQGTVAEGWIDNAIKFWEKQIKYTSNE